MARGYSKASSEGQPGTRALYRDYGPSMPRAEDYVNPDGTKTVYPKFRSSLENQNLGVGGKSWKRWSYDLIKARLSKRTGLDLDDMPDSQMVAEKTDKMAVDFEKMAKNPPDDATLAKTNKSLNSFVDKLFKKLSKDEI